MRRPSYLTFKMAPDEYGRLVDLARSKGYSVSELARKCLRIGMRFADDFEAKDESGALRQKVA